ncbi:MAG: DUF1292 domain-containing protein [Ruminococcus sp.]|nr:DUF1292 domain-containing protein [Ruminococcus sp.]
MPSEYAPDLYTLIDEDGKEQTFEVLAETEYEGDVYYAMTPYYANPDEAVDDDGLLVILKSTYEDDEEILVSVDDDETFDKVGEIFMSILEDMYEEECDDDDCDCHSHEDN